MSYDQRINRTEHTLVATSTDVLYKPYTGWLPAIGLDTIKGVLQNRNVTGNFESRFYIQTAPNRADNPDAPTLLEASYLSGANARCTGGLSVSSYTASKMLVRFGAAYHLSSGTTPGQADVHLELAYNANGKLMGTQSFRLQTPDTGNQYQPLTPFFPAIYADKVKVSLVVTGVSGNFQCRLAYRTATSIPESPNGWSTTWDAWHTGAGEFNTGELTPSASSDMWLQIAIQHALTSGTNGGAEVLATTSIRRT